MSLAEAPAPAPEPVAVAPIPEPVAVASAPAPDRQSPQADGAERRRSPRVCLEADVNFAGHDNFFTGFSQDISEGGLFVATYQLQPIGTRVEIDFTLPDDTEIHATCEVRWVRDPRGEVERDVPPGMGLRFIELSSEHQNAIMHFLQLREPMFYDD
ncbi:MAG: TIGR02266 family protein [Myxococcota bacterium]